MCVVLQQEPSDTSIWVLKAFTPAAFMQRTYRESKSAGTSLPIGMLSILCNRDTRGKRFHFIIASLPITQPEIQSAPIALKLLFLAYQRTHATFSTSPESSSDQSGAVTTTIITTASEIILGLLLLSEPELAVNIELGVAITGL